MDRAPIWLYSNSGFTCPLGLNEIWVSYVKKRIVMNEVRSKEAKNQKQNFHYDAAHAKAPTLQYL